MKEWKVRQQFTHKTHEHKDLLQEGENVRVWNREELSELSFLGSVLSYFFRDSVDNTLHYPQKSYSVALIYAKLLEKHFGEDFYEVLSDPDLLLGDKHFVPYTEDRDTYDMLIKTLDTFDRWDFENNPISQVQATVHYFKKEFLLD